MQKHSPHILNAASSLLGIALVIIAALNVAGRSQKTFADDVGWAAAMALSLSCLLSYLAMRSRSPHRGERYELWADRIFLCGLVLVVASVGVLALESA